MSRRSLVAGPWFLVSLAVLLVNDHLLKKAMPGLVTGKLSDFAGLVMAPLLLAGTVEFLLGRRLSVKAVSAIALTVGVIFAAIQLEAGAAGAYRYVLGAIWALGPTPGSIEVAHVADPWDLIALPSVVVAPLIARKDRGWPSIVGKPPVETGGDALQAAP